MKSSSDAEKTPRYSRSRSAPKTPNRSAFGSSVQTPKGFHRGVQNATELGLRESKSMLLAIEDNTNQMTDLLLDELEEFVDFGEDAAQMSFPEAIAAIKDALKRSKRENESLKQELDEFEEEFVNLEEENEELVQLFSTMAHKTGKDKIPVEDSTTTIVRRPPPSVNPPSQEVSLAQALLQGDVLYKQFMQTSRMMRQELEKSLNV